MGNLVKEKIKSGQKVLGTFVNFYSPSLVEMIGYSGYEFVILDNEHGAFSAMELENMIRAAEIVQLVPIVRVSYDLSSIQKALDRGAKGVQVPMINNEEEAKSVVNSAKYPPLGYRGAAYSIRPAHFGLKKGQTYLQKANEDVLIIVHIETSEAVENYDEILSVPGIDMAFIGPEDLSVSLGYLEGPDNSHVQDIISNLFKKGQEKGMAMGTVAGNTNGVITGFQRGACYVGLVANTIISSALREVSESKQAIEQEVSK